MKKLNLFIDIDGVIVVEEAGHDYKNRKPIKSTIEKINDLYNSGHHITLFTARYLEDDVITQTWLIDNNVKYHDIIYDKPKYDYILDDKAVSNINKLIKQIEK